MKRTISMILAIVMMLGMFCMTASAENDTLAALDIKMLDGASIRVGTVAGIRYSTLINKAQLDALTESNTVEIGTIIAPTQYVTDADAFTMAALDQFKTENNIENATYVKVPATVGTPLKTVTVEDTEYYVYAGSLENIKEQNQTLAFSGIGYVKVGEDVVYAPYNNNTNSRSVGYVAYRAYMDPGFKAEFGAVGQGLIDDFALAYLKTGVTIYSEDFSGYTDLKKGAFAKTPTYKEYQDNNAIAFPHRDWINSGEAATETAAVMNALGWSKVQASLDTWNATEYMRVTDDGKLYWYNWKTDYSKTYKNTLWSLTQIDALTGDHMALVGATGYTLQYDLTWTIDTGVYNAMLSMCTNMNGNDFFYYGLQPDGNAISETIQSFALGRRYVKNDSLVAKGLFGDATTGYTVGALGTWAPDTACAAEEITVTIRQTVNADGSIIIEMKSEHTDNFVTVLTVAAETVANTGGHGIGFYCFTIVNAYIDNISVTTLKVD